MEPVKTYNIAVFVGSLRKASINRKLANALIQLAPEQFSFHFVEIGDLPLYNDDFVNNPVPSVSRLKADIRAADGVIFVLPEYNRSVPGVLKNAIDWASRPPTDNAWGGKPAGLLGMSIGPSGAAMAQQHLRNILTCVDAPTMQRPEVFLRLNDGFFNPDGSAGEAVRPILQKWMDTYVAWVQRFVP